MLGFGDKPKSFREQLTSFQTKPARNTSLLDRAVNNLSDTATGFIPGMAHIGATLGGDAVRLGTGNFSGFGTDDLLKSMGAGLRDNSFIPALATGHPIEALHRASDRPIDALLDASMIFPAMRVANKAQMKVGGKLGNESMLNDGARGLGMRRLDDDYAINFRNAFDKDFDGFDVKDLSAEIKFADGSSDALRNFIPTLGSDVANFGDMGTFVRQTKRTLPISSLNKVENAGAADELLNSFKENSILGGESYAPSYGQDPARFLTKPRAMNESLAKIGDKTSELMGKIPAGRFSSSSRIGRKVANAQHSLTNLDVDQRTVEHENLLRRTREELKAENPEKFAALDDTTLNDTIARLIIGRAASGLGHLDDAIGSYMSESRLKNLSANDLDNLTMDEARNAGIYVEKIDPLDKKLADPYEHVYEDFDGNNTQRRFGEFRNEFENVLRGKEAKYRVKVASDRQLEAWEKARRLEEGVDGGMGARDQIANHLEKWSGDGGMDDAAITLVDTVSGATSSLAPGIDAQSVAKKILEGELDVYVNKKPWIAANPKLAEEWGVSDLSGVQGTHADIGAAIYDYRNAARLRRIFDERNKYALSTEGLYNGSLTPHSKAQEMGVVDRLREIQSDPNLPHVNVEGDAIQALFKHLDEIRDEGGKNYQEMVGENLLSDEVIKSNQARLAEWTGGDPAKVEGNGFIPMSLEGNLNKNQFHDKQHAGNRGDAFVDRRRSVMQAGDPLEVFLTGEWRTDAHLILDDYKRNRQFTAAHRLYEDLQGLGQKVHTEEAAQKLVDSKVAVRGSDIENGAGHNSNFVLVGRDDFFQLDARNMRETLLEMAATAANNGDVTRAELFRKAAHNVDMLDVTAQDMKVGREVHNAILDVPETSPYTLLPIDVYRAAIKETEAAKAALGGVYQTLTEGWKFMVLHTRFASWMRNNTIGAHLMAALAAGPMRYMKDIARLVSDPEYRAMYKSVVGDARNADLMGTGPASLMRKRRIIERDFRDLNMAQKAWLKTQDVSAQLSEVNAKWADNPTRAIRMLQGMEDQLRVVGELTGKKQPLTPELVEKYMSDPDLRGELARRTGTELVDFSDMGAFERKVMTQFFPFWSWMKGSSKSFYSLAGNKPASIWGMDQIGQAGNERIEEQHGKFLPDFAQGFYDPGEAGGMVVNTGGMNPFVTPLDLGSATAGLIPDLIPGDRSLGMSYRQYGSDNLLSNMNPIIGGAIQSLTGRNTYFGTPIPNMGVGSTMLQSQSGLPLYKLMEQLVKNETGPTSTRHTSRPLTLANYAGISLLDPRWGNLTNRGVDEMNERFQNRYAVNEL